MKQQGKSRHRRSEAGIALLISIFVLLLVSVVAIALLVSSGTETALGANYRSSTNVYYAALAGLEEARGRLLSKNPDYFNIANAGFMPAAGTQLAVGEVRYVANPDATSLTAYPDREYDIEFGNGALAAANVKTAPSVSANNAQGIPGPQFKWVRINAATEAALGLDIDGGGLDSTTPLYYDGNHLNRTSSGNQALEITSLAVLPNGSQKMVQYIVAPTPITLPPLLAALTLSDSSGNNATFNPPKNNNHYYVTGNNYDCSGNPVAGSAVPAVGVLYNSDVSTIRGEIGLQSAPASSQYTGSGSPSGSPADVDYISAFPPSLQTPSQLDALAQTIAQNADSVVPPGSSSTQTAYLTSLGMSSSNPMTVVANGDLDVSNWSHDGYGLLLVRGTFTYDPDTTWNGIVLVIGQGKIVNTQNGQNKQINGAVLVAQTRDDDGNILAVLGGAYIHFLDIMGGNGIRYSSCWIQKATPASSFKVLSFREIPQLN